MTQLQAKSLQHHAPNVPPHPWHRGITRSFYFLVFKHLGVADARRNHETLDARNISAQCRSRARLANRRTGLARVFHGAHVYHTLAPGSYGCLWPAEIVVKLSCPAVNLQTVLQAMQGWNPLPKDLPCRRTLASTAKGNLMGRIDRQVGKCVLLYRQSISTAYRRYLSACRFLCCNSLCLRNIANAAHAAIRATLCAAQSPLPFLAECPARRRSKPWRCIKIVHVHHRCNKR